MSYSLGAEDLQVSAYTANTPLFYLFPFLLIVFVYIHITFSLLGFSEGTLKFPIKSSINVKCDFIWESLMGELEL